MPISIHPAKPAPNSVGTKKVRLDGFEESGPFAEFFEIANYVHESLIEDARKAATKTVTPAGGKGTHEEYTHAEYVAYLINHQLRNWRLISPGCPPHLTEEEYLERTYTEDDVPDVRFLKFLPANIAELPWGARGPLLQEILACGGVIATRDLIVETPKGLRLDFRQKDAGVGAREGTGD